MSGGGTQKTKVENNLPPWAEKAGEEWTTRALTESRQPYQQYTGQLVADVPQDMQAGFDLARSNTGDWIPTWEKSRNMIANAATPWSAEAGARYTNPYQKQVTDIAARELVRNEDVARKSRNANAVSAGAFGSSQHGVADAESDRNLQQQISDTYLQGGASAWDKAMAAYQADRAAEMQAGGQMGALAQQQQAQGAADVEQLLNSGAAQQVQRQGELDSAYQQWLERREYPWSQLQKGSAILQGIPTSKEQTTKAPGQDQTAQYVGAGVGAAASIAAAAVMIA